MENPPRGRTSHWRSAWHHPCRTNQWIDSAKTKNRTPTPTHTSSGCSAPPKRRATKPAIPAMAAIVNPEAVLNPPGFRFIISNAKPAQRKCPSSGLNPWPRQSASRPSARRRADAIVITGVTAATDYEQNVIFRWKCPSLPRRN
jgi:hypothetical protein